VYDLATNTSQLGAKVHREPVWQLQWVSKDEWGEVCVGINAAIIAAAIAAIIAALYC
jgi:hypothetical protein